MDWRCDLSNITLEFKPQSHQKAKPKKGKRTNQSSIGAKARILTSDGLVFIVPNEKSNDVIVLMNMPLSHIYVPIQHL
jgi:hypothetical protein